MYSFLNQSSFFEELISKIQLENFSTLEDQKLNLLFELYESFTPNYKKLELNFGYVWIFENKIIFYFKKDFFYEDFFNFFENLDEDFKINWLNLEFFDGEVKVLEIFKGDSLKIKPFIRIFRNEVIFDGLFAKSKKIKQTFWNIFDSKFLFFLKNYKESNIKLILNFAT